MRQLAEHIVVLDRGSELMRGTPAEVERDARFVAAYLGTSAATPAVPAATKAVA